MVLRQTSSALTYLHEQKEPIVHRDIKPANVLIQSRYPLHIKLTDFGLARASKFLTTLCGTLLYLAPEVYNESSRKYTPAVDIWSLGVMVYELAYGLPDHHGYSGTRWCRRIIGKVNDWDSEGLINFLSTAMLVMDPKGRRSAQYCYQEALRLPVPSQGRFLTPTPASYAEGYAPTGVCDPVEEQSFNQPVSSNVSTAKLFDSQDKVGKS
jgi:serine/threonine-protein kinase Chk2